MARTYDLTRREQQARETRRRILDSARDLLLAGGYSAMTVAGLARTAGVSPQTVYNSIGGKAEVVKAVYDTMLAGDDEPLAMSDRPEFIAVTQAPTCAAFGAAYAAWTRNIYERTGALLGVLVAHGTAGDPVLEELVSTIDRERRRGNTAALRGLAERGDLPGGRVPPRLVDAVWVLTSPELYDQLVRRCDWSDAAYERWLADQLATSLGVKR